MNSAAMQTSGNCCPGSKPAAPGLKKIFLVHGEPLQQQALAQAIEQQYDIPVVIPARGDSFVL